MVDAIAFGVLGGAGLLALILLPPILRIRRNRWVAKRPALVHRPTDALPRGIQMLLDRSEAGLFQRLRRTVQ